MFADSLLNHPWSGRSRRGWATLISFAVQSLAACVLLLLPLLYTPGLPQLQFIAALVAPTAPRGLPASEPARSARETTSNMSRDGQIFAPPSVPREILQVDETIAPPPGDLSGLSVSGGTGNSGVRNGVFDSMRRGLPVVVPPPSPPTPSVQPVRVSRMMEGNLIYRVQPQYPPLARQERVQGIVVLRAMISREGKIENLQVISGHPLLVKSAVDAVALPSILFEQPTGGSGDPGDGRLHALGWVAGWGR